MTRIFLTVMAGILCLPMLARAETHTLVRGFIWGASKADVRSFETAVFWDETPDSLRFFEDGIEEQSAQAKNETIPKVDPDATQAEDYRKTITYAFTKDDLSRIAYEYAALAPPSPRTVLDLYTKERHALAAKYGEPVSEQAVWKNKMYRNHPDFWPRALGSGDLKFVTEWRLGDTKIVLQCYGEGAYYRLFYIAEKIMPEDDDKSRGILGLSPSAQTAPKAAAPSR